MYILLNAYSNFYEIILLKISPKLQTFMMTVLTHFHFEWIIESSFITKRTNALFVALVFAASMK